jgi:hypothetical protein
MISTSAYFCVHVYAILLSELSQWKYHYYARDPQLNLVAGYTECVHLWNIFSKHEGFDKALKNAQ